MISAGFDIGTRYIKVAICQDSKLIGYEISEISKNLQKLIKEAYKSALQKAGIKKSKVEGIIATGYGGEHVRKAGVPVYEANCISRAAFQLDNEVRTVIDTGGLFINIATLGSNGVMTDSATNEKCAAGSGKFLEIYAEALGIPVSTVSDIAKKSKTPYKISSLCAVFAESEIISQVNQGRDKSDIIAGILQSIALKTLSLLGAIEYEDKVALVGGVAKIDAYKSFLEKVLDRKIHLLNIDTQIVGAYGAALLAQK